MRASSDTSDGSPVVKRLPVKGLAQPASRSGRACPQSLGHESLSQREAGAVAAAVGARALPDFVSFLAGFGSRRGSTSRRVLKVRGA